MIATNKDQKQTMKSICLKMLCGIAVTALALAATTGAAESTKEKKAAPATALTEKGKLDSKDQDFLKQAAEINLTEIELGKVAERVSSDPNIKKIAAMIVKDHTAANQKLERLAASKGVTLPTAVSGGERRSLNSLEKEQGDKFNKEFLSFNMKGHEKAIALFEKEAARTQDPDIKAWAQKMVPELKEHLAMSHSGKTEVVGEKQKSQLKQQKSEKGF